MRGIPVQLSGAAVGVEDHAMVEGCGPKARDTGNEALAATGVSGDQVIDNLAGENDAVGLPYFAIDLHAIAEAGGADLHQFRVVRGNVIHRPDAPVDRVAEDQLSFIVRLAPMDAER